MIPLGHIRTPWATKFGVPRQPNLVDIACVIELRGAWAVAEAMRGIEAASHLWLLFLFHQIGEDQWQPTVRPPRLGGNKRVGVFASRSPFRPNRIGLSCVRFDSWRTTQEGIDLVVRGADLVDQTPIVDVKPVLPYTDCPENASHAWAEAKPEVLKLPIFWSKSAQVALLQHPQAALFQQQLEQTLRCDPRPPFHVDSKRVYHLQMSDSWTASFCITDQSVEIVDLKLLL